MKKLVYVAISCIMLCSVYSCSSGRYVSAQPDEMIYNRPIAPNPGYIWVDGDYYWHGGRYIRRPGYWAAPREGRAWHSGNWVHTGRGYKWNRGRWQ